MRVKKAAILSLALLVLTALAGCTGGDAAPGPATDAGPNDDPAQFSDDTGAVEGLVADDEGRPLAGATVAIIGSSEPAATSAADGSFALSNVPPGKQVLAAQKLGYESVSRSVEIVVGEITPVTLVLKALAVVETHQDSFVLTGYFDCTWYIGVTVVGGSGPCGFTGLNSTTGNPLEQFWVNSKRKWNYPVGPHLMTLVNEITWKKGTAATADELRVIISHGPIKGQERSSSHNFCVTGGVNPVKAVWEREDPEHDGACLTGTDNPSPGPKTIDWEDGLLIQSFVSVDPAPGQYVALAYQQEFQLHISRFYGEKAPEGYSAIPDT